jgi:hypothetical protein
MTMVNARGSLRQAKDRYDAANRRSAEIFLSDIDHFGGEQSLAIRWARLYLDRTQGCVDAAQQPKPLRRDNVSNTASQACLSLEAV